MQAQTILLTVAGREQAVQRASRVLAALPADKPWKVTVEAYKPKRSTSQNSLLWLLYGQILERGGEAMGGWLKEDLHQFFLIDHFGSEPKQMFGKFRQVPLQRSSALTKPQFSDFVEHIVMFMAERGVVLDLPEGEWR